METIIYNSGLVSLIIQLITGFVSIYGIFIPLNDKDIILKDIIIMETVVQFIEFLFYLWLVFSIAARSTNITAIRYIDWFITTPIMLITTMLYFAYNSNKEKFKNKEGIITLKSIFKKDYKIIIKFIIFNFLMLVFGLLGELGIINRSICFVVRTFFFLCSFKILYEYYVTIEDSNRNLFYLMFIIWSLYGLAFLLNYKYRNMSYNILDIFSKNFYGLYIFYKIMKKKKIE